MKTAIKVEKAVKLTERAVFPFDKYVIKFETFPPGQAATIIIPRAILGWGLIAKTSKKVRKGNRINCSKTPIKTNLGCLNRRLKSSKVMPKATPNIITARTKFKIQSP